MSLVDWYWKERKKKKIPDTWPVLWTTICSLFLAILVSFPRSSDPVRPNTDWRISEEAKGGKSSITSCTNRILVGPLDAIIGYQKKSTEYGGWNTYTKAITRWVLRSEGPGNHNIYVQSTPYSVGNLNYSLQWRSMPPRTGRTRSALFGYNVPDYSVRKSTHGTRVILWNWI